MKQRLKHYQIPAGGMWYYFEPISQKTFQAVTYDNLVSKLYDLYRKNGYPIGLDFENIIERGLCERHPAECEPDGPKPRRKRRMTWGDLMRGTMVLISFKAAGSPLVPVEESERRAAICASCTENIEFAKPCGGLCSQLSNAVRAVIGTRRTKVHDQLKACGICHCLLEAAVQVPAAPAACERYHERSEGSGKAQSEPACQSAAAFREALAAALSAAAGERDLALARLAACARPLAMSASHARSSWAPSYL